MAGDVLDLFFFELGPPSRHDWRLFHSHSAFRDNLRLLLIGKLIHNIAISMVGRFNWQRLGCGPIALSCLAMTARSIGEIQSSPFRLLLCKQILNQPNHHNHWCNNRPDKLPSHISSRRNDRGVSRPSSLWMFSYQINAKNDRGGKFGLKGDYLYVGKGDIDQQS